MGGRGSASSGAAKSTSAKTAGGGGKSSAEKLASTSVKSITKGMTQASVNKLSRNHLETIGILQTVKIYMKRYNMGAEQALKQAKALAPHQTTAQLRKFVWKYRNID